MNEFQATDVSAHEWGGLIPQPQQVDIPIIISNLTIQTNVDGVQIYLDNNLAGIAGNDFKLLIPNITRGEHLFAAKKDGYYDLSRKVSVSYDAVILSLEEK